MAYQLIYTSVRRGLIPGRSGYTVAARHRELRERQVSELERISGYSFSKSGASHVVYAHRRMSMGDEDFHVLTRIVEAGSDYTGRTNHVAHHLVCELSEVANCEASPAEVLLGFHWCDRYEEDPRYLGDHEIVDLASFSVTCPVPGAHWNAVRGDAADAALLIDDGGKQASAIVYAPSGEEGEQRRLLSLFAESSRLLDHGNGLWDGTFTTYLQSVDDPGEFRWIGCTDESAPARPGRRLVLDLRSLTVPVPDTIWAKYARTGTPPRPPVPDLGSIPAPDVAKQPAPMKAAGTAIKSEKSTTSEKAAAPKPSVEVKVRTAEQRQKSTLIARPKASVTRAEDVPEVSWLREHLAFVIPSVIALIALGAFSWYYFAQYKPWSNLRSSIAATMDEGRFEEVNRTLDAALEKKPGLRKRIEGFRSGVVYDAMFTAVQEGIEALESVPRGERSMSARRQVSLQVMELEDFAETYLSGRAKEEVSALADRLLRLRLGHRRDDSVATSPKRREIPVGREDVPRPTPPGIRVSERSPVKREPPPRVSSQAEREIEDDVYLVLNRELGTVTVPRSLTHFAHGREGARKLTLERTILAGTAFPPFVSAYDDAATFEYKFPETAEEEKARLLPLDRNLNLELRFRGAQKLMFVRSDEGIKGRNSNAWSASRTSSVRLVQSNASPFRVLLWSGRAFEPGGVALVPEKNRITPPPALKRFLGALQRAEPSSIAPELVMLRLTPSGASNSLKVIESERFAIPLRDPDDVFIDFAPLMAKLLTTANELENQIASQTRGMAAAGGYMEWKKERDELEAGLRSAVTELFGTKHEMLIRYRNILDHETKVRVREELRNFSSDLLTHFRAKLKKLRIDEDSLDQFDFNLSGDRFWSEWASEEIDVGSSTEFVEFMMAVSNTCRELASPRKVRRFLRNGKRESYWRVGDSTARGELEDFADEWDARFGEEAGARLWAFVAKTRPPVPKRLPIAGESPRQLPAMRERLAEATAHLGAFSNLGDGRLIAGRYEVCLVFEDGTVRPFIVMDVPSRNAFD